MLCPNCTIPARKPIERERSIPERTNKDVYKRQVVLEHFPRDVEAQVLGIDEAPHKAEMVGQQVGALVHDQHAAGIKLEPLLILFGVVVVGGVGRDKQQGVIGGSALGAAVDDLSLIHILMFLRRFSS